jgi:asparagine synthase (glutamine-hydrolysing)
LEEKGHKFSTNSDTETIVHAYEEYGDDFAKTLNGMFAFAIWDSRSQRLVLVRDRLGVKPLYYFYDERCLIFGSELKAILAHREVPRGIDLDALDSFFTFEYVPAPKSIFRGIKKLLPGHMLVLQNNKISMQRYWGLHFTRAEGSKDELARVLYDLLKDAVRIRLISDVPLGALLSGGIDSSTIVCMMSEIMNRPVKTFSIGFDDPSYNELQYARTVAKLFGTEHHELIIQPDIVNLVEDLVNHLDEPFADVSIFPTYLVSQLARQHVTVVLSGDGGDEIFAGYEWYIADKIERHYQKLPDVLRRRYVAPLIDRIPPSPRKKGLRNKLKRFVEGSMLPDPLRHFRWSIFMTEEQKQLLYSDDLQNALGNPDAYAPFIAYLQTVEEADFLWQQQFADINTYLADDILVKVDRMSMANSLEARTPYLDYRVVEFAAGLPSRLKLKGLQTKYLLKQCMAAKVPREILSRPKEGFSIPMKNWLKQELQPLMQDVLSPDRIKRQGFFNVSYVEKLKSEHLAGNVNHGHQLWSLMLFEIWRDNYMG